MAFLGMFSVGSDLGNSGLLFNLEMKQRSIFSRLTMLFEANLCGRKRRQSFFLFGWLPAKSFQTRREFFGLIWFLESSQGLGDENVLTVGIWALLLSDNGSSEGFVARFLLSAA